MRTLRLSPLQLSVRLFCISALVLGVLGYAGWLGYESLYAATFTVTRTDDPAPDGCNAGDCSLREAIIAANSAAGADTITLAAETYTLSIAGVNEQVSQTGDLDISDDLTINGVSSATTLITATANLDRILNIHSGNVTINNTAIGGGDADSANDTGGAIKNAGTLTLNNSAVQDSQARYGGGIHNSLYSYRSSNDVGGPTYSFTDISGSGTALGLGNSGSALGDIGFTFDYYGEDYDQVYVSSEGYLTFVDWDLTDSSNREIPPEDDLFNAICGFWDNLSQGGGDVYVETQGSAPNRQFIAQYENVTVGGDAIRFQIILFETSNDILLQYADVETDTTTQGDGATIGILGLEDKLDAVQYSYNTAALSDNLAIRFTPGVGTLTLNNTTITNNTTTDYGGDGGGVYSNGTVSITESTFTNNTADTDGGTNGGGFSNRGGTATVTDSTFEGNTSGENGGGLSNRFGTTTVTDSTFTNNIVIEGDEPNGGGLDNIEGVLTVRGSTISGNVLESTSSVDGNGGGLRTLHGTLIIEDSTISDNRFNFTSDTGRKNGAGGGISSIHSTVIISSSQIISNTVSSGTNSSATGSGIDAIKSHVSIDGTTVADNSNFSSENEFDSMGGGLRTDQSSIAISNSTFSGNQSENSSGGGLAHFGPPSYTVRDSNDPGGPTYNFIDISGSGTALGLGNDDSATRTLGFDFAFYGLTFSEVAVSSNGYLNFDNGDAGDFNPIDATNECSDSSQAPNLSIFAFWDDLDPSQGGEIYVATQGSAPNRQFIVQYEDVRFDTGTETITFQTILYEGSNNILIQFADVEQSDRASGESAYVSVQSADDALGSSGDRLPNDNPTFVESTDYHDCDNQSIYLKDDLAVLFAPLDNLTITNTTISNNTSADRGGGIYHHGYLTGTLALINSTTIYSNTAADGGGIRDDNDTLTISNTIVANQTGGNNCAGGVTSDGNNISNDGTCNLSASGDQADTDPQLGPLADNGGDTETHLPEADSPAIDAGNSANAPETDQRGTGFARIIRELMDIGAVEAQFPPTITSFTPTSAGEGDTVTIIGTNFFDVTEITLGGVAVESFEVVSATEIRVVVGAGASGDVSVTTLSGTATEAGFTFIPAPTITSFTPTSAREGDTVTIIGTNFTGATEVSFGGVPATSFEVISPTEIRAVVGAGATGDVSVTTPGGTATAEGFTLLTGFDIYLPLVVR